MNNDQNHFHYRQTHTRLELKKLRSGPVMEILKDTVDNYFFFQRMRVHPTHSHIASPM